MKIKGEKVVGHYHVGRGGADPDEVDEVETTDRDDADGDRVLGYVTEMQMAAMENAAAGKLTPGCSKQAQYLRLRRAKIALGLHVPRQNKIRIRSRKTKSLGSIIGSI